MAASTPASGSEDLLHIVMDMGEKDFELFKFYLRQKDVVQPTIALCRLEKASRLETVDAMLQAYPTTVQQVTQTVLLKVEEAKNHQRPGKRLNKTGPSPSEAVKVCGPNLKSSLKLRFQRVFDGLAEEGNQVFLNRIYTEIHIVKGTAAEVNKEHEIRRIEIASRNQSRAEHKIKVQDIFNPPFETEGSVRAVLTKGVAGIGKTVLTQKFSLDWAEGTANQDIQLLFPFTFRELNVVKSQRFSLVALVQQFFTETEDAGLCSFKDLKVVFIFDGLDECRLSLDFRTTPFLTDITKQASLEVILVNLIRGRLLPCARLWITTRPAAASQIPAECFDLVTEVRGFTNAQKEVYFKKRFTDREQAALVLSQIKMSRSIHIMCHIPIFCWILAAIMEHLMGSPEAELPQTLTEMYIHFLVVQAKLKHVRYDGGAETDLPWSTANRDMLAALGKLAFEQLLKGNLEFYEADLTECGLNLDAASNYSGVFTQVFKKEKGPLREKVFCFVHLSVQEFLAALHVHQTFVNYGVNLLLKVTTTKRPQWVQSAAKKLKEFTKSVNKLVQKQHERPFVTAQKKPVSAELLFYQSAVEQALQSPNGHLDLFLRFLVGLSLQSNQILLRGLLRPTEGHNKIPQEIADFIKQKIDKDLSSEQSLNLFHCLNELRDRTLLNEIQAKVQSGSLFLASKKLYSSDISKATWSALVFFLLSSDLEDFNMSDYSMYEGDLLKMMPVVQASNKVRITVWYLSEEACRALASVLTYSSTLRDLDLSNSPIRDSGLELLSEGLSPDCQLETLRLQFCKLPSSCCGPLSSVLSSQSSSLRHLDLSNNDLWDSGAKLLCSGLNSSLCRLEILRLSGCLISEEGGALLASALSSSPSHLRELDLSYNHPGPSAAKTLTALQKDPQCPLDTLRVEPSGFRYLKPGLKKYWVNLTMGPQTEIEKDLQSLSTSPLTGRCYWEVDWYGYVSVSVAYKVHGQARRFGLDERSWRMDTGFEYAFWFNRRVRNISYSSDKGRLAVYVDCPAGIVSFYKLDGDTPNHLHTVSITITEPLYAGLELRHSISTNSKANICPPSS